ncbi:hypothetical protein [Aeromicrobium ginsengisoli]|uniref:Asparagine synthetase domain-containing protein n=1 Tax=Aeromicrobium ginsengisoli TaxID=363867 RepID=A0A5M4FGU7_9ACTN|nr:hypothetical protein [Aeromicrobium ginsengisoli]KAA1399208.1 hypothetical protein ESP70_000045 [Aeromicrobium ginsengisoli]
MSPRLPHALDDYVSLYFVPDAEAASTYVRQLLVPDAPVAEDPIELLCQIIEDATRGRSEIVIPLTAGLDSRALLGAALMVLPPDAIGCITFGTARFPDAAAAVATCERLGVRHQRVDPDFITWDLPTITKAGVATWERWHSLGPIDALAIFGAMADAIGDRLVLSGYLGGVSSGSHLPRSENRRNGAATSAAFLDKEHAKNLALTPMRGRERLTAMLDEFIDLHKDLVDCFAGLTLYDLVHLGFRQNGIVRSVASGAYRASLSPFEDPRWVRHWMSKSLGERLGGQTYKQLLRDAFPVVFPDDPPPVVPRPPTPPRRLRDRFLQRPDLPPAVAPRPAPVDGRGDVRRNASMAAVLHDTVAAFDDRRIIPDVAVSASLQNLMGDSPTAKDYLRVRTAAAAEMYLRAGVLAQH